MHTFHGFPFHEFQSAVRRSAYVGLERRLGRHTDAFLAVGTAVATEALRRGTGHRGADADDPAGGGAGPVRDPATGPRRGGGSGLPAGAQVVGTVGRVDYQKAPEHFVDALAGLPDGVMGVWVGGGPLADRMLARVRQRGLTDRFRWLGHRDDVPQLLPGFDVFALASRYEGLPCVLVEAAGPGCRWWRPPSTRCRTWSCRARPACWCRPDRPRALGAAVRHLLDAPCRGRPDGRGGAGPARRPVHAPGAGRRARTRPTGVTPGGRGRGHSTDA